MNIYYSVMVRQIAANVYVRVGNYDGLRDAEECRDKRGGWMPAPLSRMKKYRHGGWMTFPHPLEKKTTSMTVPPLLRTSHGMDLGLSAYPPR